MKIFSFTPLRVVILLFLAIRVVAQQAPAQSNNLPSIERVIPYEMVMPGQMPALIVEGIDMTKAPLDLTKIGLEVQVLQNENRFPAFVKEVSQTFKQASEKSEMKTALWVMFVVPKGLSQGDASVVVSYQGRVSKPIRLRIEGRPAQPKVSVPIMESSLGKGFPPAPPSIERMQAARYGFERGKQATIAIMPLIDPDFEDGKFLITFRQGGESRQIETRAQRSDQVGIVGNNVSFTDGPKYSVRITVPPVFTAGDAVMEVQAVINGQLSEPLSKAVTILDFRAGTDTSLPLSSPRILDVSPMTIGIGQGITLVVERSTQLSPNPGKTMIVLDNGREQVQIKPTFNSALQLSPANQQDQPVILRARVGKELTGKINLRVLNPDREGDARLSAATPIEIVDHVLPARKLRVNESTEEDMKPLLVMYDAFTKAGRKFPDYDPQYNYLTLRAEYLEPDPRFLSIKLEQEGKSFILPLASYALEMPNMLVIRLPEEIVPGPLQVSLTQLGLGQNSDPAIANIVLTKSGKKRE